MFHQRLHTKKNLNKCSIRGCPKIFTTIKAYQLHKISHLNDSEAHTKNYQILEDGKYFCKFKVFIQNINGPTKIK